MPVMDGIQASKRIIALNAGIPIVAMTANVMPDDIENYVKNGIQDCVSKPFTSQELWHCLLKYFTPIENIAEKNNNHPEPLETDEKFLNNLKALFVRENSNKFDEIVNALDNDDIVLAHRLAHSLKANAGQIGKTILQGAAANVERLLKDGKKLVTEKLLKILNMELLMVLEELSAVGYKTSTAVGVTEKLEPDKAVELLDNMERLLYEGNPECLSYINDLFAVPGSDELKKQLTQLIEDFKFDLALGICAELKEGLYDK
jgi:CheY-like chemotaxis protein